MGHANAPPRNSALLAACSEQRRHYLQNRGYLRRDTGKDDDIRRLRTRADQGEAFLGAEERLAEALWARRPAFRSLSESASLESLPWSLIADKISEGIVACDERGRVILCNQAARSMLGLSALERGLERWTQFATLQREGDSAPLTHGELPLLRALHGESVKDEEFRILRPNSDAADSYLWVSITARPLDHPAGAFMTLREVTSRKRIQDELLLRDRAMSAAAEGITISDAGLPDNPLIYVNAGFERITGYPRAEVLGRNCRFLQGPDTDPVATESIRAAIREQRPCVVELLNYRKDGKRFWNRLSITPMRDAAGVVRNYVGVQSDITDHVDAERRLRKAGRDLHAANRRLTQNLEAAALVQQALLPPTRLDVPGAEFAWRFEPCEQLAGDLLNVVPLDEHHVAFYVLDVSGHGAAAALLSVAVSRFLMPTFSASSIIRRADGPADRYTLLSPREVLAELNNLFRWDAVTGQFFTILYGLLDTRSRQFRFASAGHPGPILVPATGAPAPLAASGLPIGIGRAACEERSVVLAPGDTLVFYSDGVTEAMNPRRELFGDARLLDALHRCRAHPVEGCLDDLLGELKNWRDAAPLRDDVSLVACRIPLEGDSANPGAGI